MRRSAMLWPNSSSSVSGRAEVATYVLDTSAVLAHFRKEKGWERVQALAEDPHAALMLVSISLTEFARRLESLGFPAQAADDAVANYKSLFSNILPVGESLALTAVKVVRSATGRIPLVDAIIASAAVEQQACLVHRDRHFGVIPGGLLNQLDLDLER
jgi:predicted nucleic acid-binding protein